MMLISDLELLRVERALLGISTLIEHQPMSADLRRRLLRDELRLELKRLALTLGGT